MEFLLARSNANLKQWNDSLCHNRSKGVSSEGEKRCVSFKYLRRPLVNQRCGVKQTMIVRGNSLSKLRAKTEAVRRLTTKAKSLDHVVSQVEEEKKGIEEAILLKKICQISSRKKAVVTLCFEAMTRKSYYGISYCPK